ncbi:MAG TPA: NUDIX domain-containing protein [Spirochaetota bacterium]|nr:NUDIX domain-containing protein [Spirochaetota bacterium]
MIPAILKKYDKEFPHFDDGRINYTNTTAAAALNILLQHSKQLLILKRSSAVSISPNSWSTLTGYLDELKTVKEKALEEIAEETGINADMISSIIEKKSIKFTDNVYGKNWTIFPVVVFLKYKPAVRLNWENKSYKWIKFSEIEKHQLRFFKKVHKPL